MRTLRHEMALKNAHAAHNGHVGDGDEDSANRNGGEASDVSDDGRKRMP